MQDQFACEATTGRAVAHCEHPSFDSKVVVSQLHETLDGPCTGYMAQIEIRCSHCNAAFEFRGVKSGSTLVYQPRTNSPKTELSILIEPQVFPYVPGQPEVIGHA